MMINEDERENYNAAAEQAFKELQSSLMDVMEHMRAKYGESNGPLIFFAVETALMMHAADLAIFRKKKFGNAPGLNAKTFGELAAMNFKSMLEMNKKKSPGD